MLFRHQMLVMLLFLASSSASAQDVTPADAKATGKFVSFGMAAETPTAVATSAVAPLSESSSSIAPTADLGSCDSPATDYCNCDSWAKGWYATSEVLFLHRDNRGFDNPVIVNNLTGTTLLTTRDPSFNTPAGPRLTLGYGWNKTTAIEASYFGLIDANASATATGSNSIGIPGDLGLASIDFYDADRERVTYNSRLNSAEFNVLKTFRPTAPGRISWLGGFRFLRLDERFNINSTDFNSGSSDYSTTTRNNLFGAQGGARYRRNFNRFGVEATGKGGIFGNATQQSQHVGDFNNSFVLRDATSRAGNVAFVGELNFTGVFRVNDVWGLRGGYNLLWVDGLALAPNQLDFSFTATSGRGVNHSGDVFMHGPSAGVEARW